MDTFDFAVPKYATRSSAPVCSVNDATIAPAALSNAFKTAEIPGKIMKASCFFVDMLHLKAISPISTWLYGLMLLGARQTASVPSMHSTRRSRTKPGSCSPLATVAANSKRCTNSTALSWAKWAVKAPTFVPTVRSPVLVLLLRVG